VSDSIALLCMGLPGVKCGKDTGAACAREAEDAQFRRSGCTTRRALQAVMLTTRRDAKAMFEQHGGPRDRGSKRWLRRDLCTPERRQHAKRRSHLHGCLRREPRFNGRAA
jgi:hypothetical protein